MARSPTKQSTRVDVNTFAQGLITEASPLNFPPNASVNEENFEINRDGSRDRRRGMDLENPYTLLSTGRSSSNFSTYGSSSYVWTNVAGNGGTEFVVVQIENVLYFFDTSKASLTFQGYVATLQLSELPLGVTYSFATVDGFLVVVSGSDTVATVEYKNGAFSYSLKRLKVRDVWGLEIDGEGENSTYEVDDNYRGTEAASSRVIYNLQNQSWAIPRRQGVPTSPATTDTLIDPITYFLISHNLRLPSYSETVSAGLQYKPVNPTASGIQQPTEQMFPYLYDDVRGNSVKAAKGYFIIDLLRRGQSRIEESNKNRARYPELERSLTQTRADFSPGGPNVVKQFAGRIFYAGFSGIVLDGDSHSPSLSNFILFSQVVRNLADIEKCYQEGDPTSREGNDIVDTDGGFIKVAGADKIIGLRQLGGALIVFATNGIWKVSGGSDYGFGATNHKVDKLSSVGTLSPHSIVEEVGRLYYWAKDGIYMIGPDQFESLKVENISQKTIQSFYERLSAIAKENAIGVYDIYSKKVKWLYNEGVPFTNTSQCMELVFDTVIGCFYPNRIGRIDNKVEVGSLFTTSPFVVGIEPVAVTVGVDPVFVIDQDVTVDQEVRKSGTQAVKYLALVDNNGVLNICFAFYNNVNFKDWQRVNNVGVDAKAFLISGAQTVGDSSVDKQIPYIFMHFRRTETGVNEDGSLVNESGCSMRCQWDFSNSITSKKWSPLVQAYRYVLPKLVLNDDYDTGFEIITTKNKLRGRGKAFALYLETQAGKDCRILGWNISINGNAVA